MPEALAEIADSPEVLARPYPNEHACRLQDPASFQADSFRRTERKHNGKTYSVIVGRPKGQTATREQAYRYPRSGWTAAEARAHCTSHGGKGFEAATGEKGMDDGESGGAANTGGPGLLVREIVDLPVLCREARFAPASADVDARTIEITWTTGATVRRSGFFSGAYDEVLSLKDGAVMLDRLNNSAPFLDSHRAHSLERVIGVVERAWLTGAGAAREGRATVRFSERAEVEPIWKDVQAGILRNISVGYRPHRVTKIEREKDVPLVRLDLWEPLELSLVAVPADAGAQVRNADQLYPCVVERTLNMDEVTQAEGQVTGGVTEEERQELAAATTAEGESRKRKQTLQAAPEALGRRKANGNGAGEAGSGNTGDEPATAHPAQPALAAAAEAEIARRVDSALAAERERCERIELACRTLKLEPAIGQRLIREKIPVDTAVDACFREAEKRQRAKEVVSEASLMLEPGHIRGGEMDEDTTRARAITSALLYRFEPRTFKLEYGGERYVGMSLLEIARHCLEEANVRLPQPLARATLASMALTPGYGVRAGGMHTTSDFVNILADVANKTLRRAYEQAPRTYLPFTRATTAPDFKNINRMQLSEAPRLRRKTEHGEFVRGAMTDAKETYVLATYGRIVAITREVVINDDLNAFTRIPSQYGQAAAQLESDVVYAVLLANAAMGDGTVLFHANHANLKASGSGAPAVGTVGTARAAMAKQVGLDGRTIINVMAKYLIVPPELETVAEQLVAATLVPSQTSAVVPPSIRSLTPISEPRLSVGVTLEGPTGDTTHAGSATKWYLAADPAMVDTIEYAHLEGSEGVVIESRVGWDVDGVEVRARLDFGAKAIDWRGLYRDDGVA